MMSIVTLNHSGECLELLTANLNHIIHNGDGAWKINDKIFSRSFGLIGNKYIPFWCIYVYIAHKFCVPPVM